MSVIYKMMRRYMTVTHNDRNTYKSFMVDGSQMINSPQVLHKCALHHPWRNHAHMAAFLLSISINSKKRKNVRVPELTPKKRLTIKTLMIRSELKLRKVNFPRPCTACLTQRYSGKPGSVLLLHRAPGMIHGIHQQSYRQLPERPPYPVEHHL